MTLAEVLAEVDGECRKRSIPMLGKEKAARLAELIREKKPLLVVEVGTAIGYSGLWIADTLRQLGQGRLITFEIDAERAAEARKNFERAGVDHLITQYVCDAREYLGELVDQPIDLLFLDGGFSNYYPCLMSCWDNLPGETLLVADNAAKGAAEMDDYLEFVRKKCDSHTEWFDTDLPWNPRDAMEISIVREH